jgi:hypothetical protein
VDAFQHEAQALARVSLEETEQRGYAEQFFPTKTKPDFSDGAALLEQIVGQKQSHAEVVRDLLAGHYAQTERVARRNQRVVEQVLDNFERDAARGTAWAAYNAVSQYADHQARYRSADGRLNAAWFGAGNDLKQQAYAAALALTR